MIKKALLLLALLAMSASVFSACGCEKKEDKTATGDSVAVTDLDVDEGEIVVRQPENTGSSEPSGSESSLTDSTAPSSAQGASESGATSKTDPQSSGGGSRSSKSSSSASQSSKSSSSSSQSSKSSSSGSQSSKSSSSGSQSSKSSGSSSEASEPVTLDSYELPFISN